MDEPIHLYPLAPEFNKPTHGAQVLDIVQLLYRIRKVMIDSIPNSIDSVFLIRLDDDLSDVVSCGYGPEPKGGDRSRYFYEGNKAFLARSFAYPPIACIVTIMDRAHFLSRCEYSLKDISTHVIVAVNILHGHEHDLSNSLPVRDK